MKAVVWQGPGEIELAEVPDPAPRDPGDAVVRLTVSAICGTDLHMVRGTMPGMRPGTVLGHEGVGVVEEVGDGVRAFRPGDRVVVPSTLCCGRCAYCRAGYTSQCDAANPNGPQAGTAILGGPVDNGGFDGLQARYARIPWADANLVPRCPTPSASTPTARRAATTATASAASPSWRTPPRAGRPRGTPATTRRSPRGGPRKRWPRPARSASSGSTRRPCSPIRSAPC